MGIVGGISRQMKTYGIRKDYQLLDRSVTYVEEPIGYWNETRIASVGLYQYEVYVVAVRRLRKVARRRVADVGCGYPVKAQPFLLPVADQVTLIDQPSMTRMIEASFPEMRLVPLDLERSDNAVDERFDCVFCRLASHSP